MFIDFNEIYYEGFQMLIGKLIINKKLGTPSPRQYKNISKGLKNIDGQIQLNVQLIKIVS